ncbi:MAG: B12-binding domain-containing radical SAM protein [Elusimicrobia bacterium]|nr:B12-binding domain-containing radical SAM protein [Candidatus Liberimonas magnetica]
MSTKSILINYGGYPRSTRNFVPDNGVASLAGALLAKGHTTTILDYSTVDIVKRIFPHQYKDELEKITERIKIHIRQGIDPDRKDLEAFRFIDNLIEKYEYDKMLEIAQEIFEYIESHKVDFVGIKLFLGDSFEGSVRIAQYLKIKKPGLPIFAGGPHVDAFMSRIFDITKVFDVLAYGEGEETIFMLAEFVEGKKRLEEIPNILYRSGTKVVINPMKRIEDLNALPYPVYDEEIYPAMKGDQKVKVILIDESRGCPNACNFCCHPSKSGKKVRVRNHKTVVDIMESMKTKHDIKAFRFAGSSPPPVHKKLIAQELLDRKLDFQYTTFCAVKGGKLEDFELLKNSGCFAILFGIESGSQEILNRSMNKNVTLEQVKNAVALCKKSGIATVGSVIVPAPFESEVTKNETLNLLNELVLDSTTVCLPTPIPGTKWGDDLLKYNFNIPDERQFWKDAIVFNLKNYYPQFLWKPMPGYRLNNKPFNEIAQETSEFVRKLESRGLTTQASDEILLLAHYAGLSTREFRDKNDQYFSEGNYQAISRMVSGINKNILN